jgi:SepF-like predicted cell division protein (DUF552 family)
MVFKGIKKAIMGEEEELEDYDLSDDYLELDLNAQKKENKVLVKLFTLNDYEEVNNILNVLREGYTIAVIDIKNLRQKDSIELKRAISKIKKTVDALEGNIAGFGENTVIVTPSFAKITKEVAGPAPKEESREDKFQTY